MVMGNLGIMMRQKSMVMYALFFVILAYLDHKKLLVYQRKTQLAGKSGLINIKKNQANPIPA
jgi:hypothetical protein